MARLHGREAIESGLPLHKYQDPTEGERHGLTAAEAEEITREDPSLIWAEMTAAEISRRAGEIAGCAWDDRERTGTIADQLRAVAAQPGLGGDADLTDADRRALLVLADTAEEVARG